MRRSLNTSIVLGLAASSASLAQSIHFLGVAPGGSGAYAFALSSDGSVATGYTGAGLNSIGYRWSLGSGRVDLYDAPGPDDYNRFLGISGDGSTLVGEVYVDGRDQACRRTTDGHYDLLGVSSGFPSSRGIAASFDGSVVVGYSHDSDAVARAFRWSQSTGLQALQLGGPGHFDSRAYAVSDDARVSGGYSSNGSRSYAALWDSQGTIRLLQDVPGTGARASQVRGLSSSGDICVGYSGAVRQMTLWDDEGVHGLGTLENARTLAEGVSDDGSVVVGFADISQGLTLTTAAIWTAGHGMQRLSDYLATHGVGLPDGTLLAEATSVSADGRTIAGTCITADHLLQGFVVTVPNASSAVSLVAGLSLVHGRRRRVRTGLALAL